MYGPKDNWANAIKGGGTLADAAMAQTDCKRQPEVAAQMQRLHQAVASVQASVDHLTERLGCVMRPQAPMPAGVGGNQIGPADPMTPHGQDVASLVRQVQEIDGRLGDLLQRLEV